MKHRLAVLLVLLAACGEVSVPAPPPPAPASPQDTSSELSTGTTTPTPPPPPLVRFVALGDTGKGNEAQYAVAAAMEHKCASDGCDFAVLLGDNIYDSGVSSENDAQFESKFEAPYAGLDFPFYVVLGNHDYGAGGAGFEPYKGAYQVDYTAHSTKWIMPDEHWHMAEQHLELFGLDTNAQMYGADGAQRDRMREWIAASTATWKIALGHHPYLSNGRHGNAGEYDGLGWLPITNGKGVKDFMEDIVCGKVDLYLCGHDHNRQWIEATCGGTELAVTGAGASTTELVGSNASRYQDDQSAGFLYVRIEGRTLTAQFVDQNGNVGFSRTLQK